MQDEIGRGDAGRQLARHVHADHIGSEHVDRLAQHRRLRLDAAHAPAHGPESGDHAGVRIGAYQGVGIMHAIFAQQSGREELQVDLVQDAEAGRYQPYAFVGLHRPFHEAEALPIALDFVLHVAL